MSTSLQRLGDNPRDHDGQFHGLTESTAAVSGMRPDVAPSAPRPTSSDYKPWKIYPTPPGPHWHWKNPNQAVLKEGHAPPARDDFYYETCEIPGKQDWVFKLDERGVYQVYDTAPSMSSQLFLALASHHESQLKQRRSSRFLTFQLCAIGLLPLTASSALSVMVPPRATPIDGLST
jgi:hypothetical protein